jgi:hypothetical protein
VAEEVEERTASPTSVFSPRELREQLEQRAAAEERSLSGEIRLALKQHLAEPKAKP